VTAPAPPDAPTPPDGRLPDARLPDAVGRHELALGWIEFHRLCRLLARMLADRGSWRRLVAVTRGGLVPAGIVAAELGIREIETVSIVSYDDRVQGDLSVVKPIDRAIAAASSEVLIVDDLVDTGRTAEAVRRLLPGAHLATVFAKPAGRPLVDTVVAEVAQDVWIVFPWDAPDGYPKS